MNMVIIAEGRDRSSGAVCGLPKPSKVSEVLGTSGRLLVADEFRFSRVAGFLPFPEVSRQRSFPRQKF